RGALLLPPVKPDGVEGLDPLVGEAYAGPSAVPLLLAASGLPDVRAEVGEALVVLPGDVHVAFLGLVGLEVYDSLDECLADNGLALHLALETGTGRVLPESNPTSLINLMRSSEMFMIVPCV
ncbi:hypothetical protein THAOC_27685, partial [Thalassiosira oceanica]